MQWFFIRVLVELGLSGSGLADAFPNCHGVKDFLVMFHSFDDLKKRGVILVVVLLATAIGEIAVAAFRVMRPVLKWLAVKYNLMLVDAHRLLLSKDPQDETGAEQPVSEKTHRRALQPRD